MKVTNYLCYMIVSLEVIFKVPFFFFGLPEPEDL